MGQANLLLSTLMDRRRTGSILIRIPEEWRQRRTSESNFMFTGCCAADSQPTTHRTKSDVLYDLRGLRQPPHNYWKCGTYMERHRIPRPFVARRQYVRVVFVGTIEGTFAALVKRLLLWHLPSGGICLWRREIKRAAPSRPKLAHKIRPTHTPGAFLPGPTSNWSRHPFGVSSGVSWFGA